MEEYPSRTETPSNRENSADSTKSEKPSKKKSWEKTLAPAVKYENQTTEKQKIEDTSTEKPDRDILEYFKETNPEQDLPKEASEAEAPLEYLGEEEKRLASSEAVKARQAELAAVRTETVTDPAEAAANDASELYMQKLHDKLNKYQPKELTAEEAIDIAAQETMHELSAEPENPVEVDNEISAADPVDSHEFGLASEEPVTDESNIDDPMEATASIPPQTPTTGPGGTGVPSSANSPAVPPSVIAGTGGGGGPTGPGFAPAPPGFGPPAPTAMGGMPRPIYNMGPTVIERNPKRDVGMFFAGAILGYFIGRRRGRIKTEKRLKPIQKKLEGEVQNLNARITAHEVQIRNLGYANAYQERLAKQRIVNKQTPREAVNIQRQDSQPITESSAIAAAAYHLGKETEPKLESARAETFEPQTVLTSKDFSEEPITKARRALDTLQAESKPIFKKEHLSHRDMLDMSEKIEVDNIRLSEIYRKGRIDDESLHLLVHEYMRGGDIKPLLGRELAKNQPVRMYESAITGSQHTEGGGAVAESQASSSSASLPAIDETGDIIDPPDKKIPSHPIYDPPVERESPAGLIVAVSALAIAVIGAIFWLV